MDRFTIVILKLASNFLLETLAKGNVLPERKSERLTKCIENLDKTLIDATEREVYRNVDYQTQQERSAAAVLFRQKKRILSRIS